MFPGGANPTKDNQTPLATLSSGLTLEQRIQRWMELRDAGAPFEQIQIAEFEIAEAMKQAPFQIREQLPFFQQMVKKLDATQAFQQFRLPGSERVVVDRRDQPEMGKPAEAAKDAGKKEAERAMRRDAAGELRLQEGKLVERRERGFVNYLGDRSGAGSRGALDQQVAGERVERMLSAFERMVVSRFEEGKKVASESPDGRPKFLEKTVGQWRDFFTSFLDRTVQKRALLSDIREFLLRGLIPKGAKGVFVGDINFTSGRVEKFVRFSILAEALAKLRAMAPGDAVAKGVLAGMSGEELMYLALAVSRAREMGVAMQPTQGKFLGGRAEAAAAEALGIPLDQQLKQKAKSLRGKKGGPFGGSLFEKDGPSEELPYQFVPWWHWGNLVRPGKFRWVTTLFYGTLFILAIIGIATLTVRLLGGM